MISSSNADFSEEGLSFVVRDVERLYLMLSEYGIEGGDSPSPSVIRWDGQGYLPSTAFRAPAAQQQQNFQLQDSGVTAGVYTFPTLTVDKFGRVTQIQSSTVQLPQIVAGQPGGSIVGANNTTGGVYGFTAGYGMNNFYGTYGDYAWAIGHYRATPSRGAYISGHSGYTAGNLANILIAVYGGTAGSAEIEMVTSGTTGQIFFRARCDVDGALYANNGLVIQNGVSIGGSGTYTGIVVVRNSAGTGTSSLSFTSGLLTSYTP